MISITLTDTDAQQYLQNESLDESYVANLIKHNNTLSKALDTAKVYIETLEQQIVEYKETSVVTEPSAKILQDSQLAKDVTPKFTKSKPTKSRWTKQELGVITYAMGRPETEKNRTFSALCEKIARSESSIRSKLADLGIEVRTGVLYYKI